MCNKRTHRRQKKPSKKASTREERETPEYIEWRLAVFTRDHYQCQRCRKKDCYIQAHHIRPWALFPEDRFNIKNGVTLCRKCHWKVHHSKASKFLDLGFGRNRPIPDKRKEKKYGRKKRAGRRTKKRSSNTRRKKNN